MTEPSRTATSTDLPKPRTGRPPRIRRETILRAAAARDPNELSMHSLAAELGVTHSALYHYFPTRADLVRAVAAEAAWSLAVPSVGERPWSDWLMEAGFALRGLFIDHASSLDLFPVAMTTAVIPLVETFFGVLLDNGFEPDGAVNAYQVFVGCCLTGALVARREQPHELSFVNTWLDDLDVPMDSPLRTVAPAMAKYDVDDGFREELQTVIGGIRRRLKPEAQ